MTLRRAAYLKCDGRDCPMLTDVECLNPTRRGLAAGVAAGWTRVRRGPHGSLDLCPHCTRAHEAAMAHLRDRGLLP